MIGYCGNRCAECEAFIATQNSDDALRQEVAERWSVVYNTPMTADQIHCRGCKADKELFFFTESQCEIRRCGKKRNVVHCAKCSDFMCTPLRQFVEMAPVVGENLERLRETP